MQLQRRGECDVIRGTGWAGNGREERPAGRFRTACAQAQRRECHSTSTQLLDSVKH